MCREGVGGLGLGCNVWKDLGSRARVNFVDWDEGLTLRVRVKCVDIIRVG